MSTELIDRYELGDTIGVGAAGIIHRATDRESGEVVALKTLNSHAAANPMIRARFRREINILQRLRHPNIIALKDAGGKTVLYYSMELVDGGTVKSLLDNGGRLPWPVVADLGIQLCSALQCAHNNGVIHRDLKPGNLFLTSDGVLKLADFGIARDLTSQDLTEKGQTVGTHAYMAPEQIRGEQSVSEKADLYALGCCLFEMLTHRKPFLADNHRELYDQHLKVIPPRVSDFCRDCPPELDLLVDQLLSKTPDQRPFNARQVQAKLLQLFSSEQNQLPNPRANGLQSTDSQRKDPLTENLPVDADSEPQGTVDVREQGRQILIDRIRNPHLGSPQAAISWQRLVVVAAVVLAIAAAAFVLKE
ncbi:serine/threonine protein kinase [Planctomycetes bacterium K23_9]|uniref:Serine/threonine-protein kinase PknB n=1 Tax=Stieleria marina TaxID=1930275 RepID=A0A517NPP3_9BACT|nr:Serine/threonine-protein kinase PknB [Planctomycetes bacterium K23_9]